MIALQEKKYKDFLLPVSEAGESEPLSLRGLEVSEDRSMGELLISFDKKQVLIYILDCYIYEK